MPNDQEFTLTEEALKGAVSTTCVTEDGQNVIIIVAPPSPAHSNSSPAHSTIYASDTDPEWVPSPCSSVSPSSPLRTISTESRTLKKKYQRKKPPTPPVGPYPVEKRERKKAQNRTAAFRYREKKKGEQNTVEDELELLALKNTELRAQLTKMETEAKFLKKMMTESGLGRIASTMRL
jgi:cyclic AMP-dependent transcription factor ATF-4